MSGNIQNRPRVDLTPAAESLLALYPGQVPAVVVERALHDLARRDGLHRARTRRGAGRRA